MSNDVNIVYVMSKDEAVDWEHRVGVASNQLRIVLAEGYDRKAWQALGYSSWSEHLKILAERFGFNERSVWRLHSANEDEKLLSHGTVGHIPERQLRPLSSLDTPQEKQEIWQQAKDTAPNGKLTAKHIENTVKEYKQNVETITVKKTHVVKNWYSIEDWEKLDKSIRNMLLVRGGESTFNQTNDNIEWARYSWNPITGCLHSCAYCYARDIANRFYGEYGFNPTFHPDRLTAPKNTKQKDLSQFENEVDKIGYRNVFVCSMSDLFGKWTPTEWINAVIKQVSDNPQWTFLFLTKFPIRMAEFIYPDNVWLGTTVDRQYAVDRAEKAFNKIKQSGFNGVCWLSCEPMMERLTFTSLDMFDWVIAGGASKSTQTEEFKPPREWINYLEGQAIQSGCKIYEKTNLLERIREYPKGA